MTRKTVTFIQGGGVGLDQEQSVRRLFEATGIPVDFEVFQAGRAALEKGYDAVPEDAFASIRANGIALKTKLLQPKGAGMPTAHGPTTPPNFNIEFRRRLGLFASVRPVHNLGGLPARFSNVNFLLAREITEDLYASTEHELIPGVVQSFKIVTEVACTRFFKFTFEMAREKGRKSIHCVHKANILKQADGLFLDCFRTVAKGYPEIAVKELIVDNTCMQLVTKPQQFEILAAGNLYGDLLGDLGAGLVGGISATSAINHGVGVKVYEAVYGAGPEQVAAGKGNPLPLILPAVELAKDLGYGEAGSRILTAVEATLIEGSVKPIDLGGTATAEEFTTAVISRL